MVCAARGYPFVAVMAESFSVERRQIMRAYGAKVILTPASERALGMVVKAKNAGIVTFVDSERVIVDNADEYVLRKFVGLNERTCLNQKPVVKIGQKVEKGDVLADGASTKMGELAIGKNVLVAFNTFDGYNFEDAIVMNERLVKDDTFTSIHIDAFDVEIRETKLGREEFTRDIPNVSEKMLRNLDDQGIIRLGARVGHLPGAVAQRRQPPPPAAMDHGRPPAPAHCRRAVPPANGGRASPHRGSPCQRRTSVGRAGGSHCRIPGGRGIPRP
jgi:hypothetical protein